MIKLLVTGAWNYSQSEYNSLVEMGYDICFVQYEQDELPEEAYEAEVIICNGLFLYHSIEKFTKLKKIQLTSAGFDRVPMEYIEKHKIQIYNAKGVYSKPMAEFALCGVLKIYKQSGFFASNQRQHQWIKHRKLLELSGKNVCILGCGSVGTECAKRFLAFDCNVVGVDLYQRRDSHYEKIVGMEKLDEVLQIADVVILSLPLTDDTYHLINRNRLGIMKKTAIIVNIARGQIIDTEALIEYLPNLGGAVLDVFESEPVSELSELWDMENVIITPHNSFVGEKNSERLWRVIKDNLSI